MISYKDLREGNLISSPFGNKVVGGVSADGVIYIDKGEDVSSDEVDPIPLTCEMMERAGFVRREESPKSPRIKFEKGPFQVHFHEDKFFVGDDDQTELRYVHELQNVYSDARSEPLHI